MTPDELADFLNALAQDTTILDGWAHLAQRSLPSDAPQQMYMEAVQLSVKRIVRRIYDAQLLSQSTDRETTEQMP